MLEAGIFIDAGETSFGVSALLSGPAADLDGLLDPEDIDVGDARFTVTFRGVDIDLERTSNHGWQALVPLDTPPVGDEPIIVSFLRDDEDPARSIIRTAHPFTIDELPQPVSRSQPLTVTWSSATWDDMRWYVESPCGSAGGDIAPTLSSVTIQPADWIESTDQTCAATLSLDRSRRGDVAPAFAFGGTTYHWTSRVPLTLAP